MGFGQRRLVRKDELIVRELRIDRHRGFLRPGDRRDVVHVRGNFGRNFWLVVVVDQRLCVGLALRTDRYDEVVIPEGDRKSVV